MSYTKHRPNKCHEDCPAKTECAQQTKTHGLYIIIMKSLLNITKKNNENQFTYNSFEQVV